MGTLQEQIKKTSNGGILVQRFGEFNEELVIKKPITIRSENNPITIVGKSPTVSIESKNVILENINIVSSDDDAVCIQVKKGCEPKLKDVFVKGKVEGLEGEEGDWEIPDVLELVIAPDNKTCNMILVSCPVSVKLYVSETEDIQCEPQKLQSGINHIKVHIKEIPKNRLITGELIIETVKNKIKRKIALHGNTLNAEKEPEECNDQLIWQCPSAKGKINPEYLKQMPEGVQGEPYEFILDEEQIGCGEHRLVIENLPEGLIFNPSSRPYKIEGIPKNFGKSQIQFNFEKDEEKDSYTVKLNIQEKKVIPLKISPIPDPLQLSEDQMMNMKIEILSSNSSNIKFNIHKDLPSDLHLNEITGEIFGKVSTHGRYDAELNIADGTNEVSQIIHFLVLPKKPIAGDIQKEIQVTKNESFNIPCSIDDAKNLSLKLKLSANPVVKNIKVESTDEGFEINGKLSESGKYNVKIQIEDIYKRQHEENIIIKCVDKPVYTIQWKTDKHLIFSGDKGAEISSLIEAKVVENPKMYLSFQSVGDLPSNIQLKEEGWVIVKIDSNNKYLIKIKVIGENVSSEKEFQIETVVHSSKIVTSDTKLGGIWKTESDQEQDNQKQEGMGKNHKKANLGKAFE